MVGESVTLQSTYHHCDEFIIYPLISIDCWHNSYNFIVDGELMLQENDTDRFNFSCNCHTGSSGLTCELTIVDAQVEDSGEYFCRDRDPSLSSAYFRVTLIRKFLVIVINVHVLLIG